ncbi:DNA polymerase beta superfamily protein [Candidatus Odyssella thessalonicensis]|uniref:DNA polymerase beta superfamily protein n=1 Tax=Candidatus Odyssella thessalonicensis TaxID=84647 RepID=UPI000225BAF0|nr:nucleotidyltransferase domain-containing protein [Candidatus Odyssella thessalonicensis]
MTSNYPFLSTVSPLEIIVKLKFGSHLYGTATADSDLDVKAVYMPRARDILLQTISPAIVVGRDKVAGEKNTCQDIDFEAYSPHKFLSLLAEGQIVALDMLFAPSAYFIDPPSPLWEQIQGVAYKLLNKKAASFVRYCRQQASKYGLKGCRVAAARQAENLLEKALKQYPARSKLNLLEPELHKLSMQSELIQLGNMVNLEGIAAKYIEICGKKILFSASIKTACEIVHKLVGQYGARALAAERNENVDWKALSHAVRIGYEAIEFLTDHKITFPRPEALHLVAIKQGKIPFQEVAIEIEQLLTRVEEASLTSTLPDGYDPELINEFIADIYYQHILKEKV